MMEDPNIKDRKKPTDHRQGKLIRLVDAIQRLTNIPHEEDYLVTDDGAEGGCSVNQKYQDEIDSILRELRLFDNSDFGNLYLTSGGRVVLDRGWGEYFNESDTAIFTLQEITSGIPYDRFMEKMKSVKK